MFTLQGLGILQFFFFRGGDFCKRIVLIGAGGRAAGAGDGWAFVDALGNNSFFVGVNGRRDWLFLVPFFACVKGPGVLAIVVNSVGLLEGAGIVPDDGPALLSDWAFAAQGRHQITLA